jgi:3-deoxy-D-manno-octulosonic acid kinase
MTNGRRVETASGAILLDDALFDGALSAAGDEVFDPGFWAARGEIEPAGRGRGAAWFLSHGAERWVLRHYRRGGFMGRISEDRYLWTGEGRVRAFAEYRLLAALHERGLPVPAPIAARYRRCGGGYRCDLITRRIAGAVPLSETLGEAPLAEHDWRAVGATIGRLHAAGADHADLNAHNILIDRHGAVSVIDFDRGGLRRARGAWAVLNLRRLRRSLIKISAAMPVGRFGEASWQSLLAGYAQHPAGRR